MNVEDWDDPMARAMTPILAPYWDEAGKAIQASVGLDPSAWEVTDPNLRQVIESTTYHFCHATNQTTSLALSRAYDQLREEFLSGVLLQGDALEQLTRRVQSVFDTASKSRARRIAATEASRAVHTASLLSAKQSGVVVRKTWLLSSDACPICHAIAQDTNGKGGVELDERFATVGNHEVYSEVQMPPAHPHCRCTATYVVDPDYLAQLEGEGTVIDAEIPAVNPEPAPAPAPKRS